MENKEDEKKLVETIEQYDHLNFPIQQNSQRRTAKVIVLKKVFKWIFIVSLFFGIMYYLQNRDNAIYEFSKGVENEVFDLNKRVSLIERDTFLQVLEQRIERLENSKQ